MDSDLGSLSIPAPHSRAISSPFLSHLCLPAGAALAAHVVRSRVPVPGRAHWFMYKVSRRDSSTQGVLLSPHTFRLFPHADMYIRSFMFPTSHRDVSRGDVPRTLVPTPSAPLAATRPRSSSNLEEVRPRPLFLNSLTSALAAGRRASLLTSRDVSSRRRLAAPACALSSYVVRRSSPLLAAVASANDADAPSASPCVCAQRDATAQPGRHAAMRLSPWVRQRAQRCVCPLSCLRLRCPLSSRAASLAPSRAKRAGQRTYRSAPPYLLCSLARPGAFVREMARWLRGSQGAAAPLKYVDAGGLTAQSTAPSRLQ